MRKEKKYFLIEKDGMQGMVSKDGEELIPCVFDKVKVQEEDFGLVPVKKENKWGAYSIYEKRLVVPCEYSKIEEYDYRSGVINVKRRKQGGIWGVFSIQDQEEIVPCAYKARYVNFEVGFANPKTGIFLIECGSKVGLYSLKEKKEILPCIFDIVREYDVKYGLYEVTLGDKKGIFSVDKGEVICYINKQDPNDESDEEPDREL